MYATVNIGFSCSTLGFNFSGYQLNVKPYDLTAVGFCFGFPYSVVLFPSDWHICSAPSFRLPSVPFPRAGSHRTDFSSRIHLPLGWCAIIPAHLCGLSPHRLLPVKRVFVPGRQVIPPELRYKNSIAQILELCYNFKKLRRKGKNHDYDGNNTNSQEFSTTTGTSNTG